MTTTKLSREALMYALIELRDEILKHANEYLEFQQVGAKCDAVLVRALLFGDDLKVKLEMTQCTKNN